MKKILLFVLTLLPMAASTQIKRTINVETAGTLPNLIQNDEKYEIEELTVTGELNGTDIRFIRQMSGVDYRFSEDDYYKVSTPGKLKNLDISNAKIVSGGEDYYRRSVSEYDYRFYSTKDNSISTYMFYACKLTSIKIPNSVTIIGSSAFYDCSSLTSVTIPNSVTSIGGGAFYGTAWYDNQPDGLVYAGKVVYKYKGGMPENTQIILKDGTLGITDEAFSGCSGLTSLTIPNSVTSIGSSAFDGCTGLTSLTIPNSVTSIGSFAFSGCSGLTSVTIPNSVTSIGVYAFSGCSGLTSVTIPNSVTSIGGGAFYGTAWYDNQPDGLVYAGKVVYKYKGGMPENTQIILKDGTLGITDEAFSGCSGLTSVTIPNSVEFIGSSAFFGTAWYNNQPNGLVYAGKVAYKYKGEMPANTHITIKEGTIGIGDYAFYYCSGLTSVTIPNSVTTIGGTAFFGCSGLKSVVSEIEAPFAIDNSVFNDVPSNATLIVPKGTKSAYQSKAGWNKFTNIVEIEKKQTIHVSTAGTLPDLIPDYEKNLIEELTLTGELNGTDLAFLREMAGRSRWIWFHFENANIFDLKSGEGWAQETQGKLINLDISNARIVSGGGPSLQLQGTPVTNIYSSDNTIPAGLFYDCRLTSIKLPQNVSSIESLAFGNCHLSSIIIPSSVEIIGRSAFYYCI